MNLAGSIPIKVLKDNSTGNRLGWFNWTTNIDENPPPDYDYEEALDKEVAVPLPTNKTKKSNDTLAEDESNKPEGDKKVSGLMSADLLGRRKSNLTSSS